MPAEPRAVETTDLSRTSLNAPQDGARTASGTVLCPDVGDAPSPVKRSVSSVVQLALSDAASVQLLQLEANSRGEAFVANCRWRTAFSSALRQEKPTRPRPLSAGVRRATDCEESDALAGWRRTARLSPSPGTSHACV